jgi:hypothetical protein
MSFAEGSGQMARRERERDWVERENSGIELLTAGDEVAKRTPGWSANPRWGGHPPRWDGPRQQTS